ncbi:hypothetical protein [Variovorax saccharolyticus]|uniref:hypothetical protein n=1 Tax=Variovorax saccharolyticus TaxID=3053516 RepID=UPI002574CE43|nr:MULTISPECIES: hypothetical protein [unclassified Variovorax]MDM0022345.1 hypothetical protein [Variovorax sp. J22R187]MDM0028901.1 hypothetical protein [Variovorax sp. J31P216]
MASFKVLLPLLAGLLLASGFHAEANAWARANRFGGHSSGGWGGATHTNAWGGTTSHSWDGATSHTNAWGGTTTGVAGYGAVHTTAGGFSAYRPPGYGYAGYAPYHAPVAVPYYHAGCYDCAGAVAAGAVVGMAAGAAIATAARPGYPVYQMGVNYATIPPDASVVTQGGVTYYQVGSTWLQPFYGANGVYYTVVQPPY